MNPGPTSTRSRGVPVKSIVTFPKSGISHPLGESLACRGHASAGDLEVSEVHFPKQGYYEIWARAVDSEGKSQPLLVPGWNLKGYLNNACHRIAVQAV